MVILDTQPPAANPKLESALPVLSAAAAKLNVKKMRGIPYGLNEPFLRAIKAITGEETYYRWEPPTSTQKNDLGK